MSNQLDASCSKAAEALGLPLWGTLALRVSLIILTRIISIPKGRSLRVHIEYNSISIRVSRLRRSGSSRRAKAKCTEDPAFGSTETTSGSTSQRPVVVSSSATTFERSSKEGSAESLAAIY